MEPVGLRGVRGVAGGGGGGGGGSGPKKGEDELTEVTAGAEVDASAQKSTGQNPGANQPPATPRKDPWDDHVNGRIREGACGKDPQGQKKP